MRLIWEIKTPIFNDSVCRERCYADYTPVVELLVQQGKLQREHVGWYASEHGPVNKFLDEGTREVKWSETTPPKPYVVDWKIRPVDVINPFLPADTKPEVIFYKVTMM